MYIIQYYWIINIILVILEYLVGDFGQNTSHNYVAGHHLHIISCECNPLNLGGGSVGGWDHTSKSKEC